MAYSYATERKIKAIEQHHGEDWKTVIGDLSIDAAYNLLVNDNRKHLYCRISSDTKKQLDEMTDSYGVKIAHFIEVLVEKEYKNFKDKKQKEMSNMLEQFT